MNLRKVSEIICVVFIILAIISTTNAAANQVKDVPGSANQQYRISENPNLTLNESESKIKPMPEPKIHEEENITDPYTIQIYNGTTKKVTKQSSIHVKANNSTTNTTPQYEGLLPSSNKETVFDPDGRVQVYDTTGYPWRTIVKLEMTFPNGAQYACSGSIINSYYVLTAAHCVYSSNDGGWFSSIKVIPGLDESYMPYNYAWATSGVVYNAWIDYADHRYDMAVLPLDRNVGSFTGWMGRASYPVDCLIWCYYVDPIYKGILNTAGYPGDKGLTTMWFNSDYGRDADYENHWYYMDTYGGQSGSPVWAYFQSTDERYIVTVHAYGDDGSGSNHGTRLAPYKFDDINTWMTWWSPPADYADLLDDGQSYSGFYPTTVTPGESFSAWNDVRNIGTAASGDYHVTYYASTDTYIDGYDYPICTAYAYSINPFTWGDSNCASTPFPSNIPAGTYYVGWIIDSYSNVVEFDEWNNVAYKDSYQLTVLPQPSITVLSPNGGWVWPRGTTKTITWSSTGNPGSDVRIELLKNGLVQKTISASTPNDGSYSWVIPTGQPLGRDYKIKITSTTNSAATDTSDNNFIIGGIYVNSPNGGENWARGTAHTIKWGYTGIGGNVKIQLLQNGIAVRLISSSTPNDGSYLWTVPTGQATGTTYKIKITSTTNSYYMDSSNNNFRIS